MRDGGEANAKAWGWSRSSAKSSVKVASEPFISRSSAMSGFLVARSFERMKPDGRYNLSGWTVDESPPTTCKDDGKSGDGCPLSPCMDE